MDRLVLASNPDLVAAAIALHPDDFANMDAIFEANLAKTTGARSRAKGFLRN